MPRKTTTSGQAKAPRAHAVSRPISRPSVTFQSITPDDDNIDEIQNDDNAGDDGNVADEDMIEMFTMLKEFQRRKSLKSSTRSTAFQSKKTAMFNEARKNAEAIVRDGITYLDECRAKFAELQAQQTSQDGRLRDLSLLWKTNDEAIRALLGAYPPLIEDLSHRRAAHVNDTSAMLEAHSAERQASRRRLLKNATARMEENLENQKIATDANALIKQYTGLLLS
ncbi:hypothetical protein BKA93DRAFT_220662 [Sparassis latifolia]|uniref:Uncharacterized protein n=1 Tax=Sparassis crispa TaxID=139825 RepID=A0A401GIY9_9APHY|nr:hypothetical protein SCP_0405260 [Sparassis crispa]GBE82146.1 hypothetical protein SCP_0405260 [Sparassis crispa]